MQNNQKFSKNSLVELLRYLLCGGATTLVNYLVYLTLLHSKVDYLTSNTAAWMTAVIFAYVTNRIFVFHSRNQIGRELLSFVSLRFLTLLMENLLLFGLIDGLSLQPGISKLLVSIATVLGNYAFCKCSIFQNSQKSHTFHQTNFQKGETIHE
ncbi:MAG: GtrA family protein [Lachnospiraceae bacterium]|nr:GtrA family protein [Lachnospiraceae bacterium]